MRILKEPLFHFFLIGAAIFIWFQIVAPNNETVEDFGTITIDENDIALLSDQFEARWKRRPNDAELQALADATIREEVLVREARKLGLDRGDSVIRSRLSQKMDFLTEAIATSVVPEDEDLEAFLQNNSERYATPYKLAFIQVFIGEEPSKAEVERVLASLRAGDEVSDLGGSTLLPASMPLTATRVIDSVFGSGFSKGLTTLDKGQWAGPIQSGYGVHLVQIQAIEPSQIPPLSEIYDAVLRDWRRTMSEDLAQVQYEILADNYEINVPDLLGQTK
ncbi:PPIC-type PPIASE domain-containing protein [Ruegeria halocynthiae]|uniref:PPIC-type PPIASE domain-containing protein n=1 Tax=Ruegeria halocynthiae TaxID=985054 RepID=A0A1H3DP87_9RHOB|nr:peptidylprolyl isomerase [Ruegeria halocynthiae]SDX67469.1 PPIC-type PPIASE domain-containing protein [Ruegeria halocynthiae]